MLHGKCVYTILLQVPQATACMQTQCEQTERGPQLSQAHQASSSLRLSGVGSTPTSEQRVYPTARRRPLVCPSDATACSPQTHQQATPTTTATGATTSEREALPSAARACAREQPRRIGGAVRVRVRYCYDIYELERAPSQHCARAACSRSRGRLSRRAFLPFAPRAMHRAAAAQERPSSHWHGI